MLALNFLVRTVNRHSDPEILNKLSGKNADKISSVVAATTNN